MNTKQILSRKQNGDTQFVADVLGCSYSSAEKTISRPTSKRHKDALYILSELIKVRDGAINQLTQVAYFKLFSTFFGV